MLYYSSYSGMIYCISSADEGRGYIVTPSLIGWAPTQNDTCSHDDVIKWKPFPHYKRDAGDLRRHRGNYDVIVMILATFIL